MTNLDLACMETAQAMVSGQGFGRDKEDMATKALGVLLENGPYGMVLFLSVKKNDQIAIGYLQQLVGLFRNPALQSFLSTPPLNGNADDWLRGVAQDLDAYLFVKRLWQQTLTYARYHAKAAEDSGAPAQPGA
jgi:hypothetical protein